MALNGASTGGVIFSPLWVALVAGLGFHVAAGLVAASVVAVAWVLSGRYLGRSPAVMGLVPDGDLVPPQPDASMTAPRTAAAVPLVNPWRDRRFLTLAMFGLLAQIGLVAHLFSLLVPIIGDGNAGLTMSGATACAIGGRLLLGAVMPPAADRRVVAAANAGMQAIGSLVLLYAGSSVPLQLLGRALFGLGLGNVASLPPLVA